MQLEKFDQHFAICTATSEYGFKKLVKIIDGFVKQEFRSVTPSVSVIQIF